MGAYIRWVLLVVCALLMFAFMYAHLTYEAVYGTYQYVHDGSPFPQLAARAWAAFDPLTGEFLMSSNIDEQLPVASLTKLITARVMLHDMDLGTTTTISWNAVVTEGRSGRLVAGDVMPVRELLFPLLLESSNDAAEAVAEEYGRAAFIARMNETVASLDMTQTHFADPSGLSKENVSTVADLVRMMRVLWKDDRHVFDITRLPKYVGENHTWGNGNLISARREFLGGKNGYTEEANHTTIIVFSQPLANDSSRSIGFVLLGTDDISTDLGVLSGFIEEHFSYEYVL